MHDVVVVTVTVVVVVVTVVCVVVVVVNLAFKHASRFSLSVHLIAWQHIFAHADLWTCPFSLSILHVAKNIKTLF